MSETSTGDQPPRRFYFSLATMLFAVACIAGFLAGFRVGYEQGHQTRINEIPVSRMYDVADFFADSSLSIEELIETHVSPESWDSVGGIGTISIAGDSIVVFQHVDVHEGIEALLEQLRERRKVDQ